MAQNGADGYNSKIDINDVVEHGSKKLKDSIKYVLQ